MGTVCHSKVYLSNFTVSTVDGSSTVLSNERADDTEGVSLAALLGVIFGVGGSVLLCAALAVYKRKCIYKFFEERSLRRSVRFSMGEPSLPSLSEWSRWRWQVRRPPKEDAGRMEAGGEADGATARA